MTERLIQKLRNASSSKVGKNNREQAAESRELNIGTALAKLGKRFGGIDLPDVRGQTLAEPAEFE